jgi:hypothetical protein
LHAIDLGVHSNVGQNLTAESGERQLAEEEVKACLVSSDLSQRNS